MVNKSIENNERDIPDMRHTESSAPHVNQDLFCFLIGVQWLPVVDCSGAVIADSKRMVVKVN